MKYTYLTLIILLSMVLGWCFQKAAAPTQQDESVISPENSQEDTQDTQDLPAWDSDEPQKSEPSDISQSSEDEQDLKEESLENTDEARSWVIQQDTVEDIPSNSEESSRYEKQIIEDAAEDLEALFDNFK